MRLLTLSLSLLFLVKAKFQTCLVDIPNGKVYGFEGLNYDVTWRKECNSLVSKWTPDMFYVTPKKVPMWYTETETFKRKVTKLYSGYYKSMLPGKGLVVSYRRGILNITVSDDEMVYPFGPCHYMWDKNTECASDLEYDDYYYYD